MTIAQQLAESFFNAGMGIRSPKSPNNQIIYCPPRTGQTAPSLTLLPGLTLPSVILTYHA